MLVQKVKEIYPNIFEIKDYKVNVTLIKGEKLAILWDMGYGLYDLKSLVYSMINTPLMVIASHGHRDHVLGCSQFDEVYVSSKDKNLFIYSNSKKTRKLVSRNFVRKNLMSAKEAKKYVSRKMPKIKEIKIGEKIDLGGLHAEIISLHGHTKGSIGLLIKEQELLLTGDAVCNDLWLYLPESEKIDKCIEMLEAIMKLPFKNYIAAHKCRVYPKEQILNILDVLKNLDVSARARRLYLAQDEVYENHKTTEYGTISVLFTEENLH